MRTHTGTVLLNPDCLGPLGCVPRGTQGEMRPSPGPLPSAPKVNFFPDSHHGLSPPPDLAAHLPPNPDFHSLCPALGPEEG